MGDNNFTKKPPVFTKKHNYVVFNNCKAVDVCMSCCMISSVKRSMVFNMTFERHFFSLWVLRTSWGKLLNDYSTLYVCKGNDKTLTSRSVEFYEVINAKCQHASSIGQYTDISHKDQNEYCRSRERFPNTFFWLLVETWL